MNFIKHFYPFNPAEKQQRPTLTYNTVWFKPCNRPEILNSDTLDAEILASKKFHIFYCFSGLLATRFSLHYNIHENTVE